MTDIIHQLNGNIFTLTLNRVAKHNAFDDQLINQLQTTLDEAILHPEAKVIVLNANGNHFSTGADIQWMQRMVKLSREANFEDALCLGRLLHTLYTCPKPTIAVVQGAAFGGGAGLVAACDIAIASHHARFCFSEAKLGLIPALISPYVVKAIGERLAKWLFMTAEPFQAKDAERYHLVQFCVEDTLLESTAHQVARQILENAPEAVRECKKLVHLVSSKPIDEQLMQETALLIAQKRVSEEGQKGLNAFLNKEKLQWN